jgi:hypothetical protein
MNAEPTKAVKPDRSRWTADQKSVVRDHFRTLTAETISRITGRTVDAVKRKARELGVSNHNWSRQEIEFLCTYYRTHGPRFVARHLCRSESAVQGYAHKVGTQMYRHTMEANPNKKTKALVAAIATESGLNPADILGRSKTRAIVIARWRIAKQLREAGYSYPNIGKQLGRDHTSILHGLQRLQEIAA